MPSLDISRQILQPSQRYARVAFQQGRVPLDSDANDAGALAAGELELALAETICPIGSPNDGFLVTDVAVDATSGLYDFAIGQGSFYLGGRRYERSGATGGTYSSQTDWLQRPLDAPSLPAVPMAERTDLVWLEAFEQPVSATEDRELIEPALGVDTTGRVRRGWRVRVSTDVEDDCRLAFANLVATHYAGSSLDSESGTLTSGATLSVGFSTGEAENLCTPSVSSGYLGARNETYRVRLTEPGRYIWGRDNASPLYRVRVVDHQVDGLSTGLRRVEFITTPRDQFAQPLAGQAVELHRWGSLLSNGEKQAEPTGLLLTVERGYDPADDSIVVSTAVPQEWLDWFDAEGAAALSDRDQAEQRRYFYLRLWTGGSADATAPDHPITTATLGDTGLSVTFSGHGRAGDHWVIAARPNTPEEVQPWRLLDGAPPTGPDLGVAPLALIRWRLDADGNLTSEVADCRHRIRPLCRIPTCCTLSVGDGHQSFGDVDSIAEAIARLPEAGGEICLLPGEHHGHVVLENRGGVSIRGCGARSRWVATDGISEPLLTLRNVSGVSVRGLAMEARAVNAIVMEAGAEGSLSAILLKELSIVAADRAAIAAFDGATLSVLECEISLEATSVALANDPAVGREAAITLQGLDLLIERCRITADPTRPAASQPLGGIQIGGGSERVTIRGNTITGGNGHGIILGSIRFVPAAPSGTVGPLVGPLGPETFSSSLPRAWGTGAAGSHSLFGLQISIDNLGCIKADPLPKPPQGADGEPLLPVSEGVLYDLRIHDNHIDSMGLSGISVPFFFDLSSHPDLIGIERLDVARNRIEGCLRGELPPLGGVRTLVAGYGGIALAQVGDGSFRDNEILGNGRESLAQISGIFILFAAAIVIERNRIQDNGARASTNNLAPLGRRGGVVLGVVLDGSAATFTTATGEGQRREALRLHNNAIDSPNARALKVIAIGPVSVTNNRLSGRGRSALGP